MVNELLAALPAGAAEAVVSVGLTGLINSLRDGDGSRPELLNDLVAIENGESPGRGIPEIARDLEQFLGQRNSVSTSAEIFQGDHAVSTIVSASGDVHIAPPASPGQD